MAPEDLGWFRACRARSPRARPHFARVTDLGHIYLCVPPTDHSQHGDCPHACPEEGQQTAACQTPGTHDTGRGPCRHTLGEERAPTSRHRGGGAPLFLPCVIAHVHLCLSTHRRAARSQLRSGAQGDPESRSTCSRHRNPEEREGSATVTRQMPGTQVSCPGTTDPGPPGCPCPPCSRAA